MLRAFLLNLTVLLLPSSLVEVLIEVLRFYELFLASVQLQSFAKL